MSSMFRRMTFALNWFSRSIAEAKLPVALLILYAVGSVAIAGDWPQILGPGRNGVAKDEALANDWSAAKPTKIWDLEAGEGYAGPAVQNNRVVLFHRIRGLDHLDCVSAEDKKSHWSVTFKANYGGGIDSDRGPRCVPLIAGDRVYAFSAAGDMHCVRLGDGKKIWSRSLGRDYKAQDGYFGFGSSPILVGGKLIVNVGGKGNRKAGASIVALDATSGETKWTTVSDGASYSAPITWPTPSGLNVVFISRLKLLGILPTTGKIVFEQAFGATGPTVNAASPVLLDNDRLFVTASYRIGAKCLSLSNPGNPKTIWESDDSLSSQYPTPVFHEGYLYGIHGREDGARASLRCVDAKDGSVQWKKNGMGMAHLIKVDDKLLITTVDGVLVLAEASPSEYREKGRLKISTETTRALPALSNGRLFAKSVGGELTAWKLP